MGLRASFLQVLVAVVVSWVLFLLTFHYLGSVPSKHHHHHEERNVAGVEGGDKTNVVFAPSDKRGGPAIPIHIVEEHHEVLGPWYEAAREGLLPHFGNTIFHIDGHPDNAPPPFKDAVPFKTMPADLQSVRGMMQKNDMFIVAAGLTGLLSRYIWVIPPWEPSQFVTRENPHIRAVMQLGRSREARPNRFGLPFHFPCQCVTMEGSRTPLCMSEDESMEDEAPQVRLRPQDCPTEMTLLGEMVTEARALELLAGGEWLSSNESVILDIDEDYYGVEPAGAPAYGVGVVEETLDTITIYTRRLFCPSSAQQERVSDDSFFFLTRRAKELQQACAHEKSRPCRVSDFFTFVSKDVVAGVLSEMDAMGTEETLCKHRHDDRSRRQGVVKGLLTILANHTAQQLDAIAEVGVCLAMSPKSMPFNSSYGAFMCQGGNTPSDTATPFHLPTPHELLVRSEQLERLITWEEGLKPRLVTICRSSRDGYTPRASVATIETGILAAIFSRLGPEASMNTVHYDPDLLGGKLGWHGRHEGLMGPTMQRTDMDPVNASDIPDNSALLFF